MTLCRDDIRALEAENAPVTNEPTDRSFDQNPENSGAVYTESTLSAIDAPVMIQHYFEINQSLPVISKASFLRWSDDGNEADPAYRICLRSILCSALLHEQLSGDVSSLEHREAYRESLDAATSEYGNLFVGSPSLRTVQALAAFVSCMQVSSHGAERSVSILAVAIRYAYLLSLHRLEEDKNMTVADRAERMRLFWCLYCLDRSISLKLHLPPVIDDRDLHVIRPRALNSDSPRLMNFADPLGWQTASSQQPPSYNDPGSLLLVSSMFEGSDEKICAINSDATLTLLAARQRLAIISGDIWCSLHTRTSDHLPQEFRRLEEARVQCRLLQWKQDWFNVSHPSIQWPSKHLPTIALLQFDYFLCLLKSDTETFPSRSPKDIAVVPGDSPYLLNLQRKVISGTAPWVDAARETLRLAAVVRTGGWTYLQ